MAASPATPVFSFGHPCEHQLRRTCIGGINCPLNGYPDTWCCSYVKGKINFKRDKPCEGPRCRWGFVHPPQQQFDTVTQLIADARALSAKFEEVTANGEGALPADGNYVPGEILAFQLDPVHIVDAVQCTMHFLRIPAASCGRLVGQMFAWGAIRTGDPKVFTTLLRTMKKPVDVYLVGAYEFVEQQIQSREAAKAKLEESGKKAKKKAQDDVMDELKSDIVDIMNSALSSGGQLVDREEQRPLQYVFIAALQSFPKGRKKAQEMLERSVAKFPSVAAEVSAGAANERGRNKELAAARALATAPLPTLPGVEEIGSGSATKYPPTALTPGVVSPALPAHPQATTPSNAPLAPPSPSSASAAASAGSAKPKKLDEPTTLAAPSPVTSPSAGAAAAGATSPMRVGPRPPAAAGEDVFMNMPPSPVLTAAAPVAAAPVVAPAAVAARHATPPAPVTADPAPSVTPTHKIRGPPAPADASPNSPEPPASLVPLTVEPVVPPRPATPPLPPVPSAKAALSKLEAPTRQIAPPYYPIISGSDLPDIFIIGGLFGLGPKSSKTAPLGPIAPQFATAGKPDSVTSPGTTNTVNPLVEKEKKDAPSSAASPWHLDPVGGSANARRTTSSNGSLGAVGTPPTVTSLGGLAFPSFPQSSGPAIGTVGGAATYSPLFGTMDAFSSAPNRRNASGGSGGVTDPTDAMLQDVLRVWQTDG